MHLISDQQAAIIARNDIYFAIVFSDEQFKAECISFMPQSFVAVALFFYLYNKQLWSYRDSQLT